MTADKLVGLVAATQTPFDGEGCLNLAVVEAQAEHLSRMGVSAVFVGGTTGECHSLTVDERRALAARWSTVVRGSALRLVVHVGANCLADARALAAHAAKVGASAISAMSPSYFRPRSLDALIDWCAAIAAEAPSVPFYYYDIPSMTGVSLPTPEFLEIAPGRIPTLVGIKFSNPDLLAYQRCLHAGGGRFDIPFGIDEYLLAAMSLGGVGGVGSSYNFAAPVHLRMIAALGRGDLEAAREAQYRAARVIDLLGGFGYLAAAKAVMGFLGVDVGPPRLPIARLDPQGTRQLRTALESLGFFDEIRRETAESSRSGSRIV